MDRTVRHILNADVSVDFFDVLEALRRVDAGDASMDLALPIGTIDGDDTLEYLRAVIAD